LDRLAGEYFAYLAREFPCLCLQDEFIHFPRVEAARENWFRGAALEAAVMGEAAARTGAWLVRLEKLAPGLTEPEARAEAAILGQSLRSVGREFSPGGPWERDPFLYLKTACLAWAPALSRAERLSREELSRIPELLHRVALIFRRGRDQVRRLTQPGRLLLQPAFAEAREFFEQVVPAFLSENCPLSEARSRLGEVSLELNRFQEQLEALAPDPDFALGEGGLAKILEESWGWTGGLERAEEFLQEELEESLAALAAQAAQGGRPWPELVDACSSGDNSGEIYTLYRQEVARLQQFWQESPDLPPLKGRVEVAPTPVYLRSLRSSASYAAPSGWGDEAPGYFYITEGLEDWGHHCRHHRFLSAHETIPGHHFLDAWRLSLTRPVPRQYESPLFYEGWASYAETLLLTSGYLTEDRDRLVGWQRRLWRALRGRADLELQRGRWSLEEALSQLARVGYPEATAKRQVLHLALAPGYQLCYTLGLKEILRLKETYAPALGRRRFHEVLLSGGELPFSWVEKRLRAAGGRS